ncbi:MAG: methylmalonyl Co-A mutase-associated GTPase MeaB [Flavobacteriales bacterium]
MSDSAHDKALHLAVDHIRQRSQLRTADQYVAGLLAGDRSLLSQAITLVESTAPKHKALANAIIQGCLPHSNRSLRIGITGVPGVGKSTFIESFGKYLTGLGKKVAVLAIDPTSPISKGSILGDKTRMDQLAIDPLAFIRPSPSAQTLGGVARKTKETILLCSAAGYDVILVETVGVGQSETAVHYMTDFFLLLMLAGAGDQLQGIKRGIMEMCDGMLITKADGENARLAQRASAEYASALHLFPARSDGWFPQVATCSSLEKNGIDDAWKMISAYEKWSKDRHTFEERRAAQNIHWMRESFQGQLADLIMATEERRTLWHSLEEKVKSGELSPFAAADQLLALIEFRQP